MARHQSLRFEFEPHRQIAMLETVAHPAQFIFISNAIRQATA